MSNYPNPLIEQRADPHIWLHSDGHYYFIASVPEYDRLEIRRSKTLTGLADAPAKIVWRKPDSGPMSALIWAPELHFIDGKWVIYGGDENLDGQIDSTVSSSLMSLR